MSNPYFNCLNATARRVPSASLLLTGLALLIYQLPSIGLWLQYDRSSIAAGQVWRLLTCHWVHFSSDHLFWDGLMFLVLGSLCEWQSRKLFLGTVFGSALLISLAIWISQADLDFYGGISGIDCALFAALVGSRIRSEIANRRWPWVICLLGLLFAFVVRLGYETIMGDTILVDSQAANFIAVPLAHWIGASCGLLIALLGGASIEWLSAKKREQAVNESPATIGEVSFTNY